MREIRRKGERKGEKSHRASGTGNMGDNKERKELSQPYTYIRKHTHVHIEYTLKVTEPKVHLSVEIFCVQTRFVV